MNFMEFRHSKSDLSAEPCCAAQDSVTARRLFRWSGRLALGWTARALHDSPLVLVCLANEFLSNKVVHCPVARHCRIMLFSRILSRLPSQISCPITERNFITTDSSREALGSACLCFAWFLLVPNSRRNVSALKTHGNFAVNVR
jgi:hypothetical protein